MKNSFNGAIFAVFVFGTLLANDAAAQLNYDPLLPAPAPVLGLGWASDRINAVNTPSSDSPYTLSLGAPAIFRITDDYVTGDQFKVYNFSTLILTTSIFAGEALPGSGGGGDAAWYDSSYQHGEVLLSPGNYSLTVQGNGAGGLPSGFWTRVDAVPEPGTWAVWGLGCIGLIRLRKR